MLCFFPSYQKWIVKYFLKWQYCYCQIREESLSWMCELWRWQSLKILFKHINIFCGWKALPELPSLYFDADVDDIYQLKMVSVTALSWKPQFFLFIVLRSSLEITWITSILAQNLLCSVQNLTRNLTNVWVYPSHKDYIHRNKTCTKRSNTDAWQSKEQSLVLIILMQSWK